MRVWLLTFSLFILAPFSAAAVERIEDFNSQIQVQEDGSLLVTETISVTVEGRRIRRGIFRDFPTRYRLPDGSNMRIGFEVLDVTRDGGVTRWQTEGIQNGVRVRIGDPNVLIPHGLHRYVISYRTTRQLRHGDGVDELYWNVTGNGWEFSIARASATVQLPQGADVTRATAFTGAQGSTQQNFEEYLREPGRIGLRTTEVLGPGQGFTIAVEWPAGFVTRPTSADEARNFLSDNRTLIIGILGLLIVGAYFFWAWVRVGRDPEIGPVIVQYDAPNGLSPAAAQYIASMGFRERAFTAAIVSMAVKGYLKIVESEYGEPVLYRIGDEAALSPGERAAARKLFPGGIDEIRLEQENHESISDAKESLENLLEREHAQANFRRNRGYFIVGSILAFLAAVLTIASSPDPRTTVLLGASLVVWGLIAFLGYRLVERRWQSVLSRLVSVRLIMFIFFLLYALPFSVVNIAAASLSGATFDYLTAGVLGTIVLTVALFARLLMAPTLKGRQVMNDIEGLKRYLSVAEKDRLNFHNPPKETPALFEKLLPFAIALGVENEWGDHFESVLAHAGEDIESGYQPSWYVGSGGWRGGFSPSRLTSSLGAGLTSQITAAAAAPPSSSSGGSGFSGGFSGGGGGGGGGGGW